ncbi:nucleoside-diphosphate sugar epimerase/dehydratase [Caulobacter sp. CCNWLY153]|jgi:O-antigen biosynthesis protein WbqV|uniref:Capsule biosynthesis protein CapD n=1 Tax=Caulobacter radicis TaxID=2172650 RepID=A0A2T9JU55_9CAUL|nr:nucleoside-diphosphate sugar epimerase/dehydratase [Caulobacter radicis]PVM87238.1 capsule biosynthesis protein CapD [Caulobacter radicis]
MGRAGKIAAHVFLAFLALLVGQVLAAGLDTDRPGLLAHAGLYALSAFLVELLFRLERAPWRFVAAADYLRIARSAALTALTFSLLAFLVLPDLDGGLRTILAALVVQIGLLAALRVGRRALHEGVLAEALLRLRPAPAHPALPRLLIIGTAAEAEAFLRDPALAERYAVVGLLTPEARETGDEIRGVCVLGAIDRFDAVMRQLSDGGLSPAAVLFLAEAPLSAFGAERLGRLKSEGVRLLRRQGVVEMGEGPTAAALREISLEELLSRAPVRLDPAPVRALVSGRRVLVTGAGGSIGSELCRQIAASGAAHLTMVDASEANLFLIDREIAEAWPALPRREALCDVRDADRVTRLLAAEQPDIVFHAAALKHVPMVENHPCEGVRTNVLGTRNVAIAAKAAGAAHFALISTDKAVAPSSVMGATKRVAEAIARQFGGGGQMRVGVVRFGNVLGSAGSVVPVFRHQIARGGPVTLTDANVERYFMTIPEAVSLVLRAVAQAAADAEPPAGVLTLEMGEPVKIIDLARRMIELQGLVPGKDIEIRITGLRPGEKLTEALVDINETAAPKSAGVVEATPVAPPPRIDEATLASLETAAIAGDEFGVRAQLFALVERLRATTPETAKA